MVKWNNWKTWNRFNWNWKNLTAFVHNRNSNVNNDKLLTAKKIIEDISEIYNYKKQLKLI